MKHRDWNENRVCLQLKLPGELVKRRIRKQDILCHEGQRLIVVKQIRLVGQGQEYLSLGVLHDLRTLILADQNKKLLHAGPVRSIERELARHDLDAFDGVADL